MKDDKQTLEMLLRSDARRIRKTEDFDPKLHQDTIREIRKIVPGRRRDGGLSWFHLKVSATAVMAVIAIVVVLKSGKSPMESKFDPAPKVVRERSPTPGSIFAYQKALAEGEDALLAMLDRDARVVLPKSSVVFQSDL